MDDLGRNVQTLDVSEDDTNLMSLVQAKTNRHGSGKTRKQLIRRH